MTSDKQALRAQILAQIDRCAALAYGAGHHFAQHGKHAPSSVMTKADTDAKLVGLIEEYAGASTGDAVLAEVVKWALAGHIGETGVTVEAGRAIRAAACGVAEPDGTWATTQGNDGPSCSLDVATLHQPEAIMRLVDDLVRASICRSNVYRGNTGSEARRKVSEDEDRARSALTAALGVGDVPHG